MTRVFGAYTIVFLGFYAESTLIAQSIVPLTFAAVAGETRTAGLTDGVLPMAVVT